MQPRRMAQVSSDLWPFLFQYVTSAPKQQRSDALCAFQTLGRWGEAPAGEVPSQTGKVMTKPERELMSRIRSAGAARRQSQV